MNGELTMYPPRSDFDVERGWPSGWQWDDLEPLFDRLSHTFNVTQTPSVDGNHYLDEHGSSQLKQALLAAGMQEESAGANSNSNNLEGKFRIPQVIANHGLRQSPATVLLPMALKKHNVQMQLQSEVVQLIHSKGTITGVVIEEHGKGMYNVGLQPGGAIVLACGTLNTARLLMRSGIASRSEIAKMRQKGVLNATSATIVNDHVGTGISDHPLARLDFELPSRHGLKAVKYNPPSHASLESFLTNRTGGLTQYGPLLAAYFRDYRYSNTHDVEVFVSPSLQDNVLRVYFVLLKPQCLNITVSLDAEAKLEWNNFVKLNCKEDFDKMSGAVNFTSTALRMHLNATYKAAPLDWHSGQGVLLSNHWVGSCAVGTCVDAKTMAVKGSSNLHVVDASLVPVQVTAHPWLTLAALAVRAASLIASNRRVKLEAQVTFV